MREGETSDVRHRIGTNRPTRRPEQTSGPITPDQLLRALPHRSISLDFAEQSLAYHTK